jgi:hypothetical protein
VEHRFFSAYSKILPILLTLWLFTGCEKPMENPEGADAIYQDMQKESLQATKAAEDEKKSLADVEASILKLGDRDPARIKVFQEKYAREKKIVRLEETALYFKLRAEKRKAADQDSYLKAFKEKRPWPNKGEVAAYQAQRRLELAPRSWDARVPKMGASKTPEVKKPAGEGKGEAKGE